MLFSELYTIMVKKVTFKGFGGAIAQSLPLDPLLSANKKGVGTHPKNSHFKTASNSFLYKT